MPTYIAPYKDQFIKDHILQESLLKDLIEILSNVDDSLQGDLYNWLQEVNNNELIKPEVALKGIKSFKTLWAADGFRSKLFRAVYNPKSTRHFPATIPINRLTLDIHNKARILLQIILKYVNKSTVSEDVIEWAENGKTFNNRQTFDTTEADLFNRFKALFLRKYREQHPDIAPDEEVVSVSGSVDDRAFIVPDLDEDGMSVSSSEDERSPVAPSADDDSEGLAEFMQDGDYFDDLEDAPAEEEYSGYDPAYFGCSLQQALLRARLWTKNYVQSFRRRRNAEDNTNFVNNVVPSLCEVHNMLSPALAASCEHLQHHGDITEEEGKAIYSELNKAYYLGEQYRTAILTRGAAWGAIENLYTQYQQALVDVVTRLRNIFQPRPQEAVIDSNSQLKDYVKLNLEKIAAKKFSPSFIDKNKKPKNFAALIEQTKHRIEEKYRTNPWTSEESFANVRQTVRSIDNITSKQDNGCYKDRVKARLQVYQGWEFVARPDDDGQEGFIVKNTSTAQEITVTKHAENNRFTISSAGEGATSDETIAIMLELSHSVIRFSNNPKMKMTIHGAKSETQDLTAKFRQGLEIINNPLHTTKPESERINYKFV